MSSVTVHSRCGPVEGRCEDGVCRFLGIPYAHAERFSYPIEVTHWDGTLEALDYGPAPVQVRAYLDGQTFTEPAFSHREFMEGVQSQYSEHCQFLNIWAPEHARNCPVLIVVHGGGLYAGQSNEKVFDGTAFARRGVILVTFNYRVNIFGFCALPGLEASDGRCGNYGYYDQVAAFHWVAHNIQSFGGNPQKISIIGQSAGASAVETMIKSPLNEGVFCGAILQSSAGFSTMIRAKENRKQCFEVWQEVFDHSGCRSLEDFRALPEKELFRLWYTTANGNYLKYATIVYDENFCSPRKNQPCNLPILCSLTSEDVMPLLFYFLCKRLARSQLGYANTYLYYFCRQLPGDHAGAWHSADLQYVYGTLGRSWRPFTDEDYELSSRMTRYFCNFAATGDPNGPGLPEWEPYNSGRHRFLCLDAGTCRMGQPSRLRLLHSTFFRKKAVN